MKRTLLSLFICALLFSNAGAQSQLQVRGAQLCDQNGKAVVLRGVSLGWHNLWPRFYNKGAVKTLKNEWHATVVRAAMGASSVDDHYLENPEFGIQCITPVIEAAIKNKMYVIIDWHSHEMHTAEAKAFFSKMAKKYGKYPNIIYELYNEPVNDSWEDLKTYAKEIITEIRRYDPDNVILMGCPHWDQDIDLVAANPIEGVSNVMYTVHFYAATHKDYLRDKMRTAIDNGLPVFVSECAGMEASGDGPLNVEEWQKWIDIMENLHISYVCWSLSDKNETCSMLLPRAKACGQWTNALIKPWGRMVRQTLLKYNR